MWPDTVRDKHQADLENSLRDAVAALLLVLLVAFGQSSNCALVSAVRSRLPDAASRSYGSRGADQHVNLVRPWLLATGGLWVMTPCRSAKDWSAARSRESPMRAARNAMQELGVAR